MNTENSKKNESNKFPNRHITSNRRGFDVDIMSIHRRPNFDKFPRYFCKLFRCNFDGRKIHVVSTYFFRRNFTGRKVHLSSTYFFQRNFGGRKIHFVSTYFYRYNFASRKSTLFPRTFISVDLLVEKSTFVPTYFFRCNFDGREIYVVSTYFSRCNLFSWNMHVVFTYFFRCNFDGQVSFLGIYRAATLPNNFGQLHCFEVTLVKKSVINHCYKKVKTGFRPKKKLLKVSEKNHSDVLRINEIMSKLLILSKRLKFWTCPAFSHFTFHTPLEVFYYNWS